MKESEPLHCRHTFIMHECTPLLKKKQQWSATGKGKKLHKQLLHIFLIGSLFSSEHFLYYPVTSLTQLLYFFKCGAQTWTELELTMILRSLGTGDIV